MKLLTPLQPPWDPPFKITSVADYKNRSDLYFEDHHLYV